MGSIGTMGSTLAAFSGPVVINGSSCFTISNGLSNLAIAKQGVFNNSCPLSAIMVPATISFSAYPNPVVNSFMIKANNPLATDLTPVNILLISMDGKVVSQLNTNLQALGTGYTINASGLGAGEYAIKLYTQHQAISTLKIIKSN